MSRAWLVAVGVFLYLPLVILTVFSFNASALMAFPLSGFTLAWYAKVLHNPVLLGGLWTSFWVAQPVGVLAALFGTFAALALTAEQFRYRAGFAAMLAVPFLVPKGVLAVAQVMLMSRVGLGRGALVLIAAQTLTILPFTTVILASVLLRIDPRLVEAARDLGATPWQAFRRVVLPQLRGGIGAAYSVGVILSLSDLALCIFLSGRTQPLSLIVASAFRRELSPELNAMQVLVLALTVAVVVGSEAARRRVRRAP
jgi:spermidine/putrescine transport system permease protein